MQNETNIAVVPVRCDLDVTTVGYVKDAIELLINQGCRRIVLNLQGVNYIDSSGMGLIIYELRHLRNLGGLLSLAGVSEDVFRILNTLRMADVMPVKLAGKRPAIPELDPSAQPLRRTSMQITADNLSVVRHRIEQLLEGLHLSSDELFDLCLAVGEAMGNAIDHACIEGTITTVATYPDRVVIDVEDCGEGFEFGDVDDIPCNNCDERGRGIKLMRLLTDSVTIRRRSQGVGTLVRLVKLLD